MCAAMRFTAIVIAIGLNALSLGYVRTTVSATHHIFGLGGYILIVYPLAERFNQQIDNGSDGD